MNIKIVLSIALSFYFGGLVSQNKFNCLSHELYKDQMKNDPVFKKNQEQLQLETEKFINNQSANKTTSATYIIPVVFHIIHIGGSGNISAAQVMDQITILNKEFNRQQADTALTPPAFKPLAAPFNVEFRLATLDPAGNCTNGINRIYNSLATCSYGWDDVKALSYWPSNRYLNLWIIESMHYPGMAGCGGGGYSAFPGGPANKDGIVIRGDLISNIGTSASNSSWGNFKGRYLIHELGHWFNLIHIWGDANCGNDLVNDTPPAVTDNGGCATFPHNPNNACGSNANGEMYNNYMDYSVGTCLNMFTTGQVARMTAAVSLNASRSNLWTNANLNLTGTNDPYTYPANCNAVPEILPFGPVVICQGDSVKFTDYSYGGLSTSRAWNFSGQPATSLSDSIVKVKYNAAGVYSLSLTKNYLSGSATANYVNKVHVLSNTADTNYVIPFIDSLEDNNKFANEWVVINNNNDSRKWQQVNTTSYTGFGCAGINNHNGTAPSTDEMISPPYNFAAISSATLSFWLHSAQTTTNSADRLRIYMSGDCGSQWFQIYQKSGNTLKTVSGVFTGPYFPQPGTTEWHKESIVLPNVWGSAPVRIKFSFTSGGGNNIFIDDINLQGDLSLGIKSESGDNEIMLYPNPASEMVNLSFTPASKNSIEVEVVDVLGKLCLSQRVNQVKDGKNTMMIDTKELKNGVYFVQMKQDGRTLYNTKFLKQDNR
ncbi:MAG: T9SS type A sorting domain-containing protein [Bacteroidota bacterium]